MQQEQEGLIVARMYIAQGEADDALRLLESWQAEAHEAGRTRSELEIAVLMALAYAACQDVLRAMQTLLQVLVMAQPEGFQRLFLDEGEPVAKLLAQSVERRAQNNPIHAYVEQLLAAFEAQTAASSEQHAGHQVLRSALERSNALVEPLSAQEQRVLRLLAAGLTNAEIAQKLVVSVNTVKTHLQRIYRKLNVISRREARDAARHLNLL
ncbi:MAG TPA: LuxR C-terminal-related transcriptional regulator [Roseiflexaceae bacterium]|nr:LuxR C-terminal-related transcriptional regulator [Roseiflexaceae bacterium]